MKSTTTTTSFSLFLLLCALTTTHLPSATASIIDTDGNPLVNGGTYFVLQTIIQNGGGIEYAAFGNETCPLTVAQSRDNFCKGFPIRISSMVRIRHLSEGHPLDIGFAFASPCSPVSEWTIVKGETEEAGLAVKLSGVENSVPGVFNIKRVPAAEIVGYNILFCPLDNSACGYVGVEFHRFRRLVVTESEDNRLWVRFQKLSYASRYVTRSSA